MNFNEALELLKQGKKVRRKEWKCLDTYLTFNDNDLKLKLIDDSGEFQDVYYHLSKDDMLADDWKEYRDSLSKPLLTDEEKEYLKMIFKFYPFRIRSVHLCRFKGYSYIGLNGADDYGTYYVREELFGNLESIVSYTLEELDLDEA